MTDPVAQTTLGNVLALDIEERRKKALELKISRYARAVSILSDIGECDRQMCYSITNWQDRPMHDSDLQARFDAGKEQENIVIRELMELGYEFKAGQEVVEVKNRAGETIGRGKIDGKIRYHGIDFPCEIKSMNPNVWQRIDRIEDFRQKPYLRKYIRQLLMYLYGNNVEEGLLLCTDCLGHWKIFVISLDYGDAEFILQRLERVHAHLKAKTQPDRIEYEEDICGKCAFAHICLPDIIREESEIVTDNGWIAKVFEHERLKPMAKQYDELHSELKGRFKGVKRAVAGDFVVFGRMQQRKEALIPASEFWVSTIKKLEDIKTPK